MKKNAKILLIMVGLLILIPLVVFIMTLEDEDIVIIVPSSTDWHCSYTTEDREMWKHSLPITVDLQYDSSTVVVAWYDFLAAPYKNIGVIIKIDRPNVVVMGTDSLGNRGYFNYTDVPMSVLAALRSFPDATVRKLLSCIKSRVNTNPPLPTELTGGGR